MKFLAIFRYEFSYQLRHVSTWLLFAAFLLFGFITLRMATLTDGTYLNAPGTIAFFTVFGSVIWVVTGGVVAGEIASRDIQTRMHPLAFTSPVHKLSYLGGRFLAALGINSLLLLMLYAGFLLSCYGPGAKMQFLGPFQLNAYLSNFGFIAWPTVLATTAIQFAFAALSGRAIAAYVASIGIILFSQLGGTTVRFALDWKVIGSLMDLLGTSIVAEMEGWTPIEKNTRVVLLEGTWLWNRLTWLCITLIVLVFTYSRFQLRHFTVGVRFFAFLRLRRRTSLPPVNQEPLHAFYKRTLGASRITVSDSRRSFAIAAHIRQAFSIAGTSFRAIACSRAGLTLVAILAVGTGLFAPEYMQFFGVPLLARTEEVLGILTPSLSSFKTPWIIIPLLTIFYAGELVWREREAGIQELTYTAPVPEWAMFTGKFMGLVLIIATWVVFLMVAGIINQLVMGHHHFEFAVYLRVLFGIQLTNYLLFALLVFAIQLVVNQKYLGLMGAFCAYGFILFASMLGVEHKLLIYASDTGWSYSDMRGFGPFIKSWLWFKFYWASWAFFIAVVAVLLWVRSKEGGLKTRLHLAQHRLAQHKMALFMALALVLLSGGFIFYNTNILHPYLNKADYMEKRAAYERRYGAYENIAQPALAGTKLHVEIYPDERAADVQATYLLVNKGNVAIDSIHLSSFPQLGLAGISFDRAASLLVLDEGLGYRIYALENGLAPGDSLQISFGFQIISHGFSHSGAEAAVVANGSHIDSNDWMPTIGYDDNRRLYDPRDREEWGLPPRPVRPSLYDVAARYDARHAVPMDFEAVVGTKKGQLAVAPGALHRSWADGDRQYFHYVTHAPISNEYAIFSANYAVREAQWVPPATAAVPPLHSDRTEQRSAFELPVSEGTDKPVTIQIYYHPAHDTNIERMMKSAQASLAYYAQEFGPYPYSHFRVLERPGHGRGMHAEAMSIDYQEGYSLMNPKEGGLDLPYHIMAHEVAHQWWGFRLAPAAVEGAGLLVESFATYSAMQVVEETLGYEHLLKYLSQMRQEYEVPRSRAAPPLLRANNAFLNYRKGPFALFALRNYIGKDSVNNALRRMLHNFGSEPPLPTTLDFYRELQAVTPDSLQYLVHDLFAANTFWELETAQATAQQIGAAGWAVRLEVEARKVTVDSIGNETTIPMNDWIEVGVYAPRAAAEPTTKVLYLQKHFLGSGKQTIILHVPELPGRAGIDPNHLMIDLEMEDNTKRVQVEGVEEIEEEPDLI